MAVVMNDNFAGTVGASFTGDTVYTNIAGTAPTYQATANASAKALRFPAAAQSIIGETFTATTVRTFSRIYKLSGPPTANAEVLQTRTASARGPTLSFSSGNHLRIVTGTTAVFLVTGTANLPNGTEFRVTFTVNGAALTATMYADTTTTTPLETISGTDPNGVTTMTSARDGFMAATAAGAGVTMDLSWPIDTDNTTDPGPRSYATNQAPTVSVTASKLSGIEPGETITLTVTATDPDGTIASTGLGASAGTVTSIGGGKWTWAAPTTLNGGNYTFTATATDNAGLAATGTVTVSVLAATMQMKRADGTFAAVRPQRV